jgi:hypothetical protein
VCFIYFFGRIGFGVVSGFGYLTRGCGRGKEVLGEIRCGVERGAFKGIGMREGRDFAPVHMKSVIDSFLKYYGGLVKV